MKSLLAIAVLGVIGMGAYALDRGIYLGSKRYVVGADCCPNGDEILKRCRYLFVTGVSEIDARDGYVEAPRAKTDPAAFATALQKPENGYCRLFGE